MTEPADSDRLRARLWLDPTVCREPFAQTFLTRAELDAAITAGRVELYFRACAMTVTLEAE